MVLSLVLVGVPCVAQRPEFDVATVKLAHPQGDKIDMNLGTIRHERLTLTNATLSDCVKFAYGLVSDAQLSGPDWITSKSFLYDVVGQFPAGTPSERQLIMLQNLLSDRMGLKLHHEQKQASFLALVPAKKRVKPKEAATLGNEANGPAWPGHIVAQHMSMSKLAFLLSRFQRETVIDKTGLTGFYQVQLEWTPDDPRSVAPELATDSPSLYTALQEQLGLKLERHEGPIDVLVIDRVSKTPLEN